MRDVFFMFIDGPARVIGETLGLWFGVLLPLPGLLPGFWLYRRLAARLPCALALVPAVLVSFYCITVLYMANKWTALTILQRMQDS